MKAFKDGLCVNFEALSKNSGIESVNALLDSELGNLVRARVCTVEIWKELMNHSDAMNLTRSDSRNIKCIIDDIPGWRRAKKHAHRRLRRAKGLCVRA